MFTIHKLNIELIVNTLYRHHKSKKEILEYLLINTGCKRSLAEEIINKVFSKGIELDE